jgi:hypothetical protein
VYKNNFYTTTKIVKQDKSSLNVKNTIGPTYIVSSNLLCQAKYFVIMLHSAQPFILCFKDVKNLWTFNLKKIDLEIVAVFSI